MSLFTVSLAHLTKEFKLEMLYRSSDFEKIQITVEDVNRPALPGDRIQMPQIILD